MTEDVALKRIGGDLRIVGIVLASLGTLVSLNAASALRASLTRQTMLAAGVLILLLPGVWFTVAASLVRGGRGAMIVRWSLRVVAMQVAACAIVVGLVWLGDSMWSRFNGPPVVAVPALLLVVFAPAQAVLVWQLIRARHLIDARDARRGFAATEAPVIADVVAMPIDANVDAIPIAQMRDEVDLTAQRSA